MFLSDLPAAYEIHFFDHFHPTISDPGAYCTAQKLSAGKYAYYRANHGWSSKWEAADLDFLTEYLYKNREFNTDYFRIDKVVKRAEVGKRVGEY